MHRIKGGKEVEGAERRCINEWFVAGDRVDAGRDADPGYTAAAREEGVPAG